MCVRHFDLHREDKIDCEPLNIMMTAMCVIAYIRDKL